MTNSKMTKVPVLHTDGHLGLLYPLMGIIVWQDGMVDSNIPWTIIAEYILRYDKLVAAEFRKLTEIKIGDYFQGDDWLCKVTAVRRMKIEDHLGNVELHYGFHHTQITLTAVDNKEVTFKVYSDDLGQFSRVEAPRKQQIELEPVGKSIDQILRERMYR